VTRQDCQQLFIVLINLRMGLKDLAIEKICHLLNSAEAEHAIEDAVNASLEQAAKGTGDDSRPV
jgi:hypothetical protein